MVVGVWGGVTVAVVELEGFGMGRGEGGFRVLVTTQHFMFIRSDTDKDCWPVVTFKEGTKVHDL